MLVRSKIIFGLIKEIFTGVENSFDYLMYVLQERFFGYKGMQKIQCMDDTVYVKTHFSKYRFRIVLFIDL